MSTSLTTMIRLRAIQNKIKKVFEGMSDIHYRLQYHHDLSPAGWHLGHTMFIENYWLHQVILNDDQYTKDTSLYIPANCPKPERGPRLPPVNTLLEEIQQQQDDNAMLLMEMIPPVSDHPLFKDEYIQNFIIQHYAQHYETIQMILNQIQIRKDKGNYQPEQILKALPARKNITQIKADEYQVGGEKPLAYDNELPVHNITINDCYISSLPVTNSEYLFFIEQGGYQNPEFWSDAGWQWKDNQNIQQPEHWRQNAKSQWYGINQDGPFSLIADNAVYGLSHYEALAYASFAGARLPHEHEWEIAAYQEILTQTAQCWEWCDNTFFPYDGFKPFPYNEYSKPWFDKNHYLLKGGSEHTRPEIKRATFRNFYQPHQRHMFAGLRLAYDTP